MSFTICRSCSTEVDDLITRTFSEVVKEFCVDLVTEWVCTLQQLQLILHGSSKQSVIKDLFARKQLLDLSA